MQHANWQCAKCSYDSFDTDEFRAVGGMVAKLLDVQNKRFSTVTCEQCGFTEIYRAESSQLGDVFDFFAAG